MNRSLLPPTFGFANHCLHHALNRLVSLSNLNLPTPVAQRTLVRKLIEGS